MLALDKRASFAVFLHDTLPIVFMEAARNDLQLAQHIYASACLWTEQDIRPHSASWHHFVASLHGCMVQEDGAELLFQDIVQWILHGTAASVGDDVAANRSTRSPHRAQATLPVRHAAPASAGLAMASATPTKCSQMLTGMVGDEPTSGGEAGAGSQTVTSGADPSSFSFFRLAPSDDGAAIAATPISISMPRRPCNSGAAQLAAAVAAASSGALVVSGPSPPLRLQRPPQCPSS